MTTEQDPLASEAKAARDGIGAHLGDPDVVEAEAAELAAEAPETSGDDANDGEETAGTSEGHGFLVVREHIPMWMYWVLGIIPILLLFLGWWLLTGSGPAEERIISPTILPSPLEVAQSFKQLWFERALTRNTLISLRRVALGFAVGTAIAFPLGLFMGSFTKIRALFNPLATLGAYLPIPALVPLTLSLLGTGERQKVGFLALAFLIYLLPLIVAAVDKVDDVFVKTALTLGASKWQVVSRVLFGVSWADIYQSLRLGFGIGWSYILLAEMVDIGQGLGGIIMTSQRRGPREHIYLVLLVIIAIAFVTDRIWAAIGEYLFPYRRRRKA